jgi:hypothetical protein
LFGLLLLNSKSRSRSLNKQSLRGIRGLLEAFVDIGQAGQAGRGASAEQIQRKEYGKKSCPLLFVWFIVVYQCGSKISNKHFLRSTLCIAVIVSQIINPWGAEAAFSILCWFQAFRHSANVEQTAICGFRVRRLLS